MNESGVIVLIAKAGNLALRFLLELCALASLGYWGFHNVNGAFVKIACGIGAPLAAIIVWGLFVAPKAIVMVSGPLHLLLELVVLGSAAIALYAAGRPLLGLVFALSVIINRILMSAWNQ